MLKEIFDTLKSELLAEFKTGEGTDVPSQVTLVSPADGFNTGNISNADFEWEAAAGAELYKIQIASDPLFASVVYEQDNISYLKHTVPDGILSDGVQYYWRVRAKNQWGYGSLSEARSWLAGTGYEAETTDLLSGMTTQPDEATITQINTRIQRLKDAGIFQKLDCLWMPGAHTNDNGEAYLNWIKNDHHITLGGGVATFTPDIGIQGNGSTGWLRTDFIPSVDGVNYQRDSASCGIYARNAWTGVPVGIVNSLELYMNGATNALGAINGGEWTLSGTVLNSKRLTSVIRDGANSAILYKGGIPIATSTQDSTALSTKELFLCARNNGSGVPAIFSNAQIFAIYIGGALTAEEVSILDAEIKLYADFKGASVE